MPGHALSFYDALYARDINVELTRTQCRSSKKEVKEHVLFILRRGCRAGVELL